MPEESCKGIKVQKIMGRARKCDKEAKYPCAFCGVCFTRSNNRNRHERGCLAQGGSREGRGVIKITPFKETEYYRCEKCHFTSKVRRDVLIHLNKEHSSVEQQRLLLRRADQERRRLRAVRQRQQLQYQQQEGAGASGTPAVKKEPGEEEAKEAEEPKPGPSGLQKKKKRKKRASTYPEYCPLCKNYVFNDRDSLLQHIEETHSPQAMDDPTLDKKPSLAAKKFLFFDTALQGALVTYRRVPLDTEDPNEALDRLLIEDNAQEVLMYQLAKMGIMKVGFAIRAIMIREGVSDDQDVEIPTTFQNEHFRLELSQLDKIPAILKEEKVKMMSRLEDFQGTGSGWNYHSLVFSDLTCYQGPRLYSGRSGSSVKDVKEYIKRHFSCPAAFEPVGSYGNASCFYFAVCQGIFGGTMVPGTNIRKKRKLCSRAQLRQFMIKSGMKCNIGSPANLDKISSFEAAQKSFIDIRVNIHTFSPKTKRVTPYLISKRPFSPLTRDINLLLLDLPSGESHFVYIGNLGKTGLRSTPLPKREVKIEGVKKEVKTEVKEEPLSDDEEEEEEEDDDDEEAVARELALQQGPTPGRDRTHRGRRVPLKHLLVWEKDDDEEEEGEEEDNARSRSARLFICPRCYHQTATSIAMQSHEVHCMRGHPQRITMPKAGQVKSFIAHEKSIASKFFGVMDFECKVSDETDKADTRYMRVDQQFHPVSFGLVFIDDESQIRFSRYVEAEEDLMERLFETLEEAESTLKPLLQRYPYHNLSKHEADAMKAAATHCHICREPFTTSCSEDYVLGMEAARKGLLPSNYPEQELAEVSEHAISENNNTDSDVGRRAKENRSRPGRSAANFLKKCNPKLGLTRCVDHDHENQRIRGIAHVACNVRLYSAWSQTKIYLHNFSKFDAAFLVQGLKGRNKTQLRKLKIRAMAHNSNTLRILKFGGLTFTDSLAFFQASLDTLTQTLVKSGHRFEVLRASGLAANPEQLALLKRKLPFPYSSLTSLAKFHEMRTLPPKEAFDNDLTLEKASDETYELAKEVWTTFGFERMSQMLHLYQMVDVYLLAEAIVAFRQATLLHFQLDMTQFLSSSALAFAAYLKSSKMAIPLITDRQTYDHIQAQIRGKQT